MPQRFLAPTPDPFANEERDVDPCPRMPPRCLSPRPRPPVNVRSMIILL